MTTQFMISSKKIFPLDLIIILLLLTLWLGFGPFQLYPPIGWADPLIYKGYIKHYAFNLAHSPPTYFSNRFAFILLGQYLYSHVTPELANFLMILIVMVVFCSALHILVGYCCGRFAASLAVVIFSANPVLLAAMSFGYVNGMVMAWMLVGFTAAIVSLQSVRYKLLSFTAGVFFMLAVLTHLVALIYLTGAIAGMLMVYSDARRCLLKRISLAVLGGICVVCVFAVISNKLNGDPNFFQPSLIHVANDTSLKGANPFAMPFLDWGPYATRVWFIFICAVVGLIFLIQNRLQKKEFTNSPAYRMLSWATLSLIIDGTLMLVADVILHTTYYTYWFYSGHLVVFACIILSSMHCLMSQLVLISQRQYLGLQLTLLTVGFLAAIYIPYFFTELAPNSLAFVCIGLFGVIVCVATTLTLTINREVVRPRTAVTLLAMTVIAPALCISLNPDTRHVYNYDNIAVSDAALAANEADDFILSNLQDRNHYFFWYARASFNAYPDRVRNWNVPTAAIYPLRFSGNKLELNFFDSIWFYYYPMSSNINFFSNARTLAESTPEWQAIEGSSGPASLVILSVSSEETAAAIQVLSLRYGSLFKLAAEKTIRRGPFIVHITILNFNNSTNR